jgi:2,4-dienoyl-CoA reductase-like NADH-dependent reductase (Old Yellow Enzyme family)
VEYFGKAASYAAQSGVDLIEIHAAHGYLISGFLSPSSNLRTDCYGGTLSNRFRILYEILEECLLLSSVPVGVRINCRDNISNGLTVKSVISGLQPIKSRLAYVSVSGGVYTRREDVIIPSRKLPKALWKSDAKLIKKKLGIPVFIGGNIESIATAESIVSQEIADVTLMGRSLLADPGLLMKHISGKQEAILECTDCRECKWHSLGKDSIYCPFNPVLNNK